MITLWPEHFLIAYEINSKAIELKLCRMGIDNAIYSIFKNVIYYSNANHVYLSNKSINS